MKNWLHLIFIFGFSIAFSLLIDWDQCVPIFNETKDGSIVDQFVLVNSNQCNYECFNNLVDELVKEKPLMIMSVEGSNKNIFNFESALEGALHECERGVSKFKTKLLLNRLADFDFDTTNVPSEIVIDFYNDTYKDLLIVTPSNADQFILNGKILIIGDMGSSTSRGVIFDSNSRLRRVKGTNSDLEFIYKNQLLALVIHSIVTKRTYQLFPSTLLRFLFSLFFLIIGLLIYFTRKFFHKGIWLYLVVKICEAIVLISMIYFIFVRSEDKLYVFNTSFVLDLVVAIEAMILLQFYFFLDLKSEKT